MLLEAVKMSCIKSSTEVLLFIVYKHHDDNEDYDFYTGKFFSAASCVKMGFVSNM